MVTANGGDSNTNGGAGIGGGGSGMIGMGDPDIISISGGTITATAGTNNAMAIGRSTGNEPFTITINGTFNYSTNTVADANGATQSAEAVFSGEVSTIPPIGGAALNDLRYIRLVQATP
jgi:hypothetical protein